jgi:8-oxo-dGTP pyrophosphatase MutT (NUDIX family)
MKPLLQQAGVIPYRHHGEALQVLLITSRHSGRWLIPKGGIEKNHTPAEAAAREAYEEAGVQGILSATPFGSFTYSKRQRGGAVPASVEVYTMRVTKELKNWPERAERRLKWLPIADAIRLVDAPGIALLLQRFQEMHELAPTNTC